MASLVSASGGFLPLPNPEAAASSISFTIRPVFCCIKSRRSQRIQSTNWRSKRIFSFGSNDTILQNDIPDLKMLLHSKQVLQQEDLPLPVIEPDPNSSVPEAAKPKQQAGKTHNLVFVAAEVAPYSKVGGLSDVCGSLPVVLAARGHRVMVVSPRYINGVTDHRYAGAYDAHCRINIGCFSGQHEVAFFHEFRDGVDWVFVDHCCFHRPGNPYGDSRGAFGDNQFSVYAVPVHVT